MTDHEMVLLRAAVEAGQGSFEIETQGGATSVRAAGSIWFVRATLADALTALLRDLGADVPEWPSAERVAELQKIPFAADEGLTLPECLALRGGA